MTIYRVLFVTLLSLGCAAATQSAPVPGHACAQESPRVAQAVRVDRAPKLDGTLNDPLWQLAKTVTDFRHPSFERQRNFNPPEQRTAQHTLPYCRRSTPSYPIFPESVFCRASKS